MTDKRDYYDVLGVNREADAAALKKAYRRLAMKYHPDQNPDDAQAEANFKEITEAYQVLSDDTRRRQYDRFGHRGSAPGGYHGVDPDMDIGTMTDFFESIFGSVFSGGTGRRRRTGSDLQYDLSVTMEQVVSGADLKVTLPRQIKCDACDGSGAQNGTAKRVCATCHGHGQVRLQQGIFAMSSPCPSCKGKGTVITEVCAVCGGNGLKETDEEYDVSLPPGIPEGMIKTIPGGGDWGRGGLPPGDLHIRVRIEKHDIFERQDDDLVMVQTITYPQAVLGDEIRVDTINGSVKMKIKPGTRAGQVYVLRGKGVPHLRGSGNGDQRVRIDVDIPRKPTDRQKYLISELGKELGTDVKARHPSFLDKVKSLFA